MKTVASDVTGTWKSEFDSQIGRQQYTFTFKQDGAKLTGKANSEAGDRKREAELKEGKVDGDKISFGEMLSIQDNEIRIDYIGKLSADGNEIKFTRQVGDFAKTEIVAKRVQSATTTTAVAAKIIRIKAGKSEPVKDAEGNVWLADQGFEGGETVERPDIQIANTKSPDLYRAERYSMNSFSWPVPNGKYVVKLHFAETFEGITGPGERVFSFNVQGREFKDFDVWVKAGGALKAYVETVNAEVTDGKIKVTFTPKVENPQIFAIEIVPQSTAEPSVAGASAPAATAPATTVTRLSDSADQGRSVGRSNKPIALWPDDRGNQLLIRRRVVRRTHPQPHLQGYGRRWPRQARRRQMSRQPAPTAIPHWTAVTKGSAKAVISLDNENPVNTTALITALRLEIAAATAGDRAGVANDGFWGIPVRPSTSYAASFYAKASGFTGAKASGITGPLTVAIESTDGNTVYASGTVDGIGAEWKKHSLTLTTAADVKPTADTRFVISAAFARHALAQPGFAVPADL